MKKYFILLITIFIASFAHGQRYYSFNDLDSLQKVKEKKVIVFVHTNWCNYCKAMDEKVFKASNITQLLDEQYYLVRLDAEAQQDFSYGEQRFKYNASLGYHELAIALAGGAKQQLVFPATYMLNNKNEILFQRTGFINPCDLLNVLKYVVTKN